MRSDIFYFSGTGNSLKVARDLALALGEARVISIPKVIGQEIDLSADRIGIVFPVYMFGMPLIISEFIKKMKAGNDKYIFAIATYGGMSAGTLAQTEKELASVGLKLSAGFGVVMPGNYTPLYGAIDVQKQKKMFDDEGLRIKEIAKAVREGAVVKAQNPPIILNLLFSGIFKVSSPQIPRLDKGFWADEKCNSCGTCVRVCPVNNVYLENGKPAWRHKCEQCFACLQWCPTEAIQYKKSTIGRKRYVNPDVKVQDIISGK